jgi:hypothetical protein
VAENGSSTMLLVLVFLVEGRKDNVPLLLVGLGEFELNSIDAIYAVNKENEDEDKCDLHPVL